VREEPRVHWVRIDVAAKALGVQPRRALVLARRDQWTRRLDPAHRHGRAYLYDLADIRATARTRRSS